MESGRAQPNILVIMTDQHRFSELGFLGSVARTPNIDRLATESIAFLHTFCQAPVCLPSRASFISERYVRDHGVAGNDGDLPHDLPTFPLRLREAGFHTAMIGKCDLYRDRTVGHTRETIYRMNQYGFDEPIETGGQLQTAVVRSEYTDYLEEQGVHYFDLARSWSERHNYRTRTIPMWHVESHPLPADLYLDSWVGQRTARWIETYSQAKPWFMWSSFPGPHDPWDAPAEFVDRYRDADIPPVQGALPDLEGLGPYASTLERRVADSVHLTDDVVREVRRFYYANIDLLDREIGRILDALEVRGFADNTWVVFTSDHGEMLGDHGLITKQVFYESSVQVPLIIRPPGGIRGRQEAQPVEQVDLSATLLSIAAAQPIPDGAGKSLLHHFGEGGGSPREVVKSSLMGFSMFATADYKLVVEDESMHECQLFDLKNDPLEDRNLANDAGYARICAELLDTYVRPHFSIPRRAPAGRLAADV